MPRGSGEANRSDPQSEVSSAGARNRLWIAEGRSRVRLGSKATNLAEVCGVLPELWD